MKKKYACVGLKMARSQRQKNMFHILNLEIRPTPKNLEKKKKKKTKIPVTKILHIKMEYLLDLRLWLLLL